MIWQDISNTKSSSDNNLVKKERFESSESWKYCPDYGTMMPMSSRNFFDHQWYIVINRPDESGNVTQFWKFIITQSNPNVSEHTTSPQFTFQLQCALAVCVSTLFMHKSFDWGAPWVTLSHTITLCKCDDNDKLGCKQHIRPSHHV